MKLILNLLITSVIAYFLQEILSGVHFENFSQAIVFSIILALLSVTLKPILKVLGLPFTIMTLGVFSLIINSLVVMMADYFVDGVQIDGFLSAFVFSILLSFISSSVSKLFISDK